MYYKKLLKVLFILKKKRKYDIIIDNFNKVFFPEKTYEKFYKNCFNKKGCTMK